MTSDADVTPTAQDLLDSGAKSLLLTLADNSGAVRAKYVPRDRIASVATRGTGLSPLLAVMGARGALTRSPHAIHPCQVRRMTGGGEILDVARIPMSAGHGRFLTGTTMHTTRQSPPSRVSRRCPGWDTASSHPASPPRSAG